MSKKTVLENARKEGLALTFNDVRLRTGYSDVMPDEVSLETKFSRNVGLKIPLVSAAMDKVTEYGLATELAKLGGIGVIHRALGPEEQANQVAKVKNHLNGLIEKPICIYEDETVNSVLQRREKEEYTFHSFPVLNRNDELVGVVARTDFEFCNNSSTPIKKIMSTHPITAHPQAEIDYAHQMMKEKKTKLLPLISADRHVYGMYVFSDVDRIRTRSAEGYNIDQKGQLRVAAAIGTGEEALERAKKLVEKNVDVIVIDAAHAYSKPVVQTLISLKSQAPETDIVVGNVSTGEAAIHLADRGADGIKVGQGPGSICTTRIIAGIGRPQVSAVYDCMYKLSANHEDVPICADGGLENSGDITIALGAGAHSVMLGSMFAGTTETPGEIISTDGTQWKVYRGMGSLGAMENSSGSRDRYKQGNRKASQLIPEGVEGRVPFKGDLSKVVTLHTGGLRTGMGYVGAKSIEELRSKSEFDRITSAGIHESHPHNIVITHDSPNYRGCK